MTPSRTRPESHDRGRAGERAAARYLRAAGYRIVERNLRTRSAEIDLLVRRGRLWVAVEVKTRSLHPAPELLVDPATVLRLQRALRALAPTLSPRPRRLRVDIVAVRCPAGAAQEFRHFPGDEFC